MVQKPKKKGVLGVINLRLQNDALVLKQLHKFYSKKDIPWVSLIWSRYYTSRVPHASTEVGSFWWKDLLRLNVLYRGIAKCTIGDGSTIAFWGDLWSTDILSEKFPRLFSFAINPDISVKEIIMAQDLDSIFHLPISGQASQELGDLQDLLLSSDYDLASNDSWSFMWGNQLYSSNRYYNLVFQHFPVSPIFKRLWQSKCTPRLKFFAWLLLVDRLNTRNMLLRRHYNVHPNSWCVLCSTQEVEDLNHLFFTCPFALSCWNKLSIQWDASLSIQERVLHMIGSTGLPCIMEIFVITVWEIWNIRNSKIFYNGSVSFSLWFRKFSDQVHLQLMRVREDKRISLIQWLESIT